MIGAVSSVRLCITTPTWYMTLWALPSVRQKHLAQLDLLRSTIHWNCLGSARCKRLGKEPFQVADILRFAQLLMLSSRPGAPSTVRSSRPREHGTLRSSSKQARTERSGRNLYTESRELSAEVRPETRCLVDGTTCTAC